MGVDVDESWAHDAAARVDLVVTGAVDLADGGQASAGDGNVAYVGLPAAAVDDQAIADYQIMLDSHQSLRFGDAYARFGISLHPRRGIKEVHPVTTDLGRDQAVQNDRASRGA